VNDKTAKNRQQIWVLNLMTKLPPPADSTKRCGKYYEADEQECLHAHNVKVSDGSRPAVPFGLFLTASAGSHSLDRLVCRSLRPF